MKTILVDVKPVEGTGWVHMEYDNEQEALEFISLLLKTSKYPVSVIMETRIKEAE